MSEFSQNKEENINEILENIEIFIGNLSLKAISKHANH